MEIVGQNESNVAAWVEFVIAKSGRYAGIAAADDKKSLDVSPGPELWSGLDGMNLKPGSGPAKYCLRIQNATLTRPISGTA